MPFLNPIHSPARSTAAAVHAPRINSLWIGGPLSTMERLSMLSHLRHGHDYHLWVYDDLDAPKGVQLEDASTVCDRRDIFSYQVGQGKGSVSAFSNLFRYRLLMQQGGWWCDTDVVALKPFTFGDEYVFASQVDRDGTSSVTSCVIKTPPGSDVMRECHERAMAVDRSTLTWGVIGPRLLTNVAPRYGLERYVRPADTFCPAHWFEAETDPAMHTWSLGKESYAVHLWHEMWRRNGIDKDGTYPGTLYDLLKAPYARALDTRPRLRRWLDGLRGISGHAARTAQTPASVTVALARPVETSTPGSPIVDWTDLRLETSAKQLAYGEHRISLLTRVPEGPLLFTPGTLEDHVATPFVSLAQTASGRALSLAVEGHPAGRSGCAANLQDQNFNVLASVQCDAGGERRKTVAVSARVARVRVVFQAARLEPGCLPARVRVLDHIG